jgi:hypothetical protein
MIVTLLGERPFGVIVIDAPWGPGDDESGADGEL